uniref:Uncharacterized protein n=1 Tax=Zea mays TaxID=4577 RepID=B6SNX6_MAIZE|nr:hypothetical protein [Zea mays]
MATSAPPPSSAPWLEWAAEYTKAAQAEARPPPEWAARVAAAAAAAGESEDVPWSAGLAEVLARALFPGGGGGGGGAAPAAAAWKYAEAALAARLASPALLLALLSTRVIPHRLSRPMEYRLYLELLKRHGFNFHHQMKAANFRKCAFPLSDCSLYFLNTMLKSVVWNENQSNRCSVQCNLALFLMALKISISVSGVCNCNKVYTCIYTLLCDVSVVD